MQSQLQSFCGPIVPSLGFKSRRPRQPAVAVCAQSQRFRLNNIGPAPGSRRAEMRKGRGHSAGQGQSCGFGMRGQNARSGSTTRPGFEGGQQPLYKRIPKLKGIAGGMGAGLPSHVVINLKTIEAAFGEGDVVSLDTLQQKRILNLSGREAKLGLKVLAAGELSKPVTIKAESFSETALEKIAACGGTAEVIPRKAKWTRKAHEAKQKTSKK